jgi:hypothetical protein
MGTIKVLVRRRVREARGRTQTFISQNKNTKPSRGIGIS